MAKKGTQGGKRLTLAQACRARVRRLRQATDDAGCGALLVTNPVDIKYLTGFHGEASVLLVQDDALTIVSDFRFQEELEKLAVRARVVIREGLMPKALEELLGGIDCDAIGVQSEHMRVSTRHDLAKRVGARRLRDTEGILGGLRVIKDDLEVRAIRKAIGIQQEAFEAVLGEIGQGTREREVCASLEWHMKTLGSEEPAFSVIVAAGSNSSLPHAVPGSKRVLKGKPLLVDWGATVDGYRSDMTRTLSLGSWPRKLREVYGIVLEAQRAAIGAIGPGIRASEIDGIARGMISDAGFGPQFGHGLGHGIGLDIHEAPRLASTSEDVLEEGMVVTVEPGVYLPGVGGVRIEDDVLVTSRGHRVLSSMAKDQDWATR
ncbi:MAG: M24 family metallopeptidase [Planctomycetota bacterium]|jgi:Xaa-Pro aminopeptidase